MGSNSKELLLVSLGRFYSKVDTIEQILPIINGDSKISLRLLDWFVTNYSKKYGTIITKSDQNNNIVHFNVYLSYRSQLKAYSKHQFDPFRRRERIEFYYDKDKAIQTTIGQLNFFKWVLQNNILQHVEENIKSIEKDMISLQKDVVKAQQQEKVTDTKKRTELSKSTAKNMNHFDGVRMISFA